MIWNPVYIKSKEEPLPPPGKAIEDYTWDEISQISKAGKASEYFGVGDIKSILFNGTTYYVQIIGFDHDDVSDAKAYGRDKAGITFQFGVANDSTKNGIFATTYPMNGTNTNVNSWRGSIMRTSTMPLMKGYMSNDLKNVLVTVNKLSGLGNSSSSGTETTEDELFLLAEIEAWGTTTYSVTGEGRQYKFYANASSRVRYNNKTASSWWERSPYIGQTLHFCRVGPDGNANVNGARESHGVSFAFCV